jgi:lipopolysaccharide biosynthesis glycosyltransferase
MSTRLAVCYVASDGYLFQTVLSATQARQHLGFEARIFVLSIGRHDSEEAQAFRRACDDAGVELLSAPADSLSGLPIAYARLFLDLHLPADIDEILYLDGDTQVVDDLGPLLLASPPEGGVIGVKDPMVFIRETSPAFRRKVDQWWEESEIPSGIRSRYINSGMLRVRRHDLTGLRAKVVALHERNGRHTRFLDQDLINIALGDDVATASLGWNFPGFLLGTAIAEQETVHVTHFMSDPRPWQAPYSPWGARYFAPYAALAARYPEIARYWGRATPAQRIRYQAQQLYKHVTERRLWQSVDAERAVERMRLSDSLRA